MNAAQLTSKLAKRLDKTKAEVDDLLAKTTGIIAEQLSLENVVSIYNFGALELKKRKERISVNPATGLKTLIPPKLVIGYKASPTLKDKIKEAGL